MKRIFSLLFRYDESLHIPIDGVQSDLRLWSDSYRCKWTDVNKSYDLFSNKFFISKEVPQTEVARYFVKLNQQHLSSLNHNSKIITFSHFLTSRYV